MAGGSDDFFRTSVDRVIESRTFRNAPSSRRLLRYLADQSLTHNGEQLKEYTIGIDAFGKPADYDPRLDSTVRIQIGRLRQKLSEYYREEGSGDTLVVDLPKGRFNLVYEPRSEEAPAEPAEEIAEVPAGILPSVRFWRFAALALAGFCAILLAGGGYAWWSRRTLGARQGVDNWSSALAEIWGPFVNSPRPMIIGIGNPLFLQFQNKSLYRDPALEKLDDLLKSPALEAVRKALRDPETRPVYYYAAVGDVTAAFLLGQRLSAHQSNISVVRSSQLQWEQLASSNVVLLGPPRFFGEKLASLPAPLEITETAEGFLVAHPQPGEPSLFKFREPAGFFVEDGEACVLITRSAGPVGDTDVMTFASNSTFGRAGAVHAFTDAAFAATLMEKMRGAAGHIPRYFQVLLRVKYKSGVPTETSFLLYRQLRRRS